MMIFNLIKKDILIVKKYVLIMFAAAVLIPPFMLWRAPEYTGILGFMLSVIFCVLMLLQYVSLKEYQFPKAATLLCATPFSRKMMVLSKYIFCIAVYIACCVIYAIETLLIPALGTVNVTMFFLMLFVTSLFIGVYLPLQYKIGYEKTKFAFVVVIMASPFILPQLMKMENVNLNFLSAFSPLLVCGSALVFSWIILIVSVVLSMKFYGETDLA
jgi:ABC-2 type transport system permease protein